MLSFPKCPLLYKQNKKNNQLFNFGKPKKKNKLKKKKQDQLNVYLCF